MKRFILILVILAAGVFSYSQKFSDLKNMQKYEGYFDFYYNESKDQICLVVEELDQEFLYVHSLSSGLGHNDLMLDRGQLDELLNIVVDRQIRSLPSSKGYREEVFNTVGFIVIDHMIRLANETDTSPQVNALAAHHLSELKKWLEDPENGGPDPIYKKAFIDQISKNKVKHLDHLPALPPGSPIGMECMGH